MCTALDPPIMEGLTRWGRTNRFLREELIPAGWGFDNPRNLPRTIHPSGEFAIVATTGDELTGLAELLPATKYAKGYATAQAVGINEQLALDFGDFDLGPDDGRAAAARDWRPGSCCSTSMTTDSGPSCRCPMPSLTAGSPAGPSASSCRPSRATRTGSPLSLTSPGADQDEDIVVAVSRR